MGNRVHIVVKLWICVGFALSFSERAQAENRREDPAGLIVTGRVLDPSSQPVSDASVLVQQKFPGSLEQRFEQARTDAEGNFEIKVASISPAAGVLPVRVYQPGFAIAQQSISLYRQPTRVHIDFQLVRPAAFKFEIDDEEGKPVSDASLAYVQSQGTFPDIHWLSTDVFRELGLEVPRSDEDGLLEIPWLSSDQVYDFGFDHTDFARGMSWSVRHSAKTEKVKLEQGAEVEFLVLFPANPAAIRQAYIEVLIERHPRQAAINVAVGGDGRGRIRLVDNNEDFISLRARHPSLAALGSQRYRGKPVYTFSLYEKSKLCGRVLDSTTKRGVEGVSVRCVAQGSVIATLCTDADGRFESQVAATDLEISASTFDGHWTSDGRVRHVRLGPGETEMQEDLFVRTKPPLRGQVLLDRIPVSSALVRSVDFDSELVLTDDEGRFELAVGDAAALPVVVAMHPHKPFSAAVQAIDAEQQDVVVDLQLEGSLVGRVVDANDRSLADQRIDLGVSVEQGRSNRFIYAWQTTLSRQDGTFRFQGLCEGLKYQAYVRGIERLAQLDSQDVRTQIVGPREALRHRLPLRVSAELRRELESLPEEPAALPARLRPIRSDQWMNSHPLGEKHFVGKPTLLCFGLIPDHLLEAEEAHRLFSPQGLVAIGILPSGSRTGLHAAELLNAASITLPLVFDEGQIAQDYHVAGAQKFAFFGSDGSLIEEIADFGTYSNMLHVVRNRLLHAR